MKKIALLALAALVITSCGKDSDIFPEKALYKRLSSQGGVWDVEKIETYSFDNQGNETLTNTETPEQQYVFFEHSEVFDYNEQYDLAYKAAAVLTKDQGGATYHLIAERERIIFEDYGIILGPQITYTIREDKANKQVWEQYSSNTRRVIYLKRCPGCEPYYPMGQMGGI